MVARGYEIRAIILIFSVPKIQNSYEEEKNYISNHGDTNILTCER